MMAGSHVHNTDKVSRPVKAMRTVPCQTSHVLGQRGKRIFSEENAGRQDLAANHLTFAPAHMCQTSRSPSSIGEFGITHCCDVCCPIAAARLRHLPECKMHDPAESVRSITAWGMIWYSQMPMLSLPTTCLYLAANTGRCSGSQVGYDYSQPSNCLVASICKCTPQQEWGGQERRGGGGVVSHTFAATLYQCPALTSLSIA